MPQMPTVVRLIDVPLMPQRNPPRPFHLTITQPPRTLTTFAATGVTLLHWSHADVKGTELFHVMSNGVTVLQMPKLITSDCHAHRHFRCSTISLSPIGSTSRESNTAQTAIILCQLVVG